MDARGRGDDCPSSYHRGSLNRRGRGIGSAIAEHCPEHIEAPPGPGKHRLDMGLSLEPFPVVIATRSCAGLQRGERGEVGDPEEPAVVTSGPVVIAAGPSRVFGRRGTGIEPQGPAGLGTDLMGVSDGARGSFHTAYPGTPRHTPLRAHPAPVCVDVAKEHHNSHRPERGGNSPSLTPLAPKARP